MKKSGFTLIEMLVVTALAAMILSVVFITVSNTKAKSRDARREHDIKEIQNALNLYQVNHRSFPQCGLTVINGSNDCLSAELVQDGAMMGVPIDPLRGSNGTCGDNQSYVYCYESNDGVGYEIRYHLETDSIPKKSKGWQTVGP